MNIKEEKKRKIKEAMVSNGAAVLVSNPWERTDRYGECGLAPQPWYEMVRIFLCLIFIAPMKIFGSVACLLSFFLVTKVAWAFPKSVRSDWVAALGKIHCRICLLFIGFIRVRWVHLGDSTSRETTDAGMMPQVAGIVSNHCSWCDILVHMSHFFPSFVARSKTEHMKIVGSISKSMGCLYVERSKTAADDAMKKGQNQGNGVAALVKQRMQGIAHGRGEHERPLLLFPEGTTTNGHFLLPFRTGAFLAGEPLQPVIVQYETRGVSPCWESVVAHRHIILMLCNVFHSVTCYTLPVYYPTEKEKQDPVLYAANVRKEMLKASGLRPSHETYPDKVTYTTALKLKHGYHA
ncbi:hypothetical protein M9434_003060 [Picochlorum sp. BPE23]|nr:hypothetical protein M9434_003060 [Picochlorum sp. BPE23]